MSAELEKLFGPDLLAALRDLVDARVEERLSAASASDEWLTVSVRQTTLEHRERFARVHLLPAFGEQTPPSKLTAGGLQALYDRMLDGGYKSSPVRAVHTYAREVLARSVRLGRLNANPADLVEMPPRNKPKKARVFDGGEADRFAEVVWRTRRYVSSSSRSSRASAPRGSSGWSTRTSRSSLLAGRRWSAAGGAGTLTEPKTAAGRRTVYFPAVI